jgi:hypothetical protein
VLEGHLTADEVRLLAGVLLAVEIRDELHPVGRRAGRAVGDIGGIVADAVLWTYGIAGLFNVIHNEPEKVAPHSEGCFLGPCIIV